MNLPLRPFFSLSLSGFMIIMSQNDAFCWTQTWLGFYYYSCLVGCVESPRVPWNRAKHKSEGIFNLKVELFFFLRMGCHFNWLSRPCFPQTRASIRGCNTGTTPDCRQSLVTDSGLKTKQQKNATFCRIVSRSAMCVCVCAQSSKPPLNSET